MKDKEIIDGWTDGKIVYWDSISAYENLSEEFIGKYSDSVSWDFICMYQDLSEEFIEKYKEKIDWKVISKHRYMSEAFILSMIDILTEEIFDNKNYARLSDKTKRILEFKFRR